MHSIVYLSANKSQINCSLSNDFMLRLVVKYISITSEYITYRYITKRSTRRLILLSEVYVQVQYINFVGIEDETYSQSSDIIMKTTTLLKV